MKVSIGEKLKTMRLNNNMTQKDLAGKITASLSVICDVENNRRTPSKKICLKLSQYFNTNVDYWFNVDNTEGYRREKFFYLENSIKKLLEYKSYKNGIPNEEIWSEILVCLGIDIKNIIKDEEKIEAEEGA